MPAWCFFFTWESFSRLQAESKGWQWRPGQRGKSKGRGRAIPPFRHNTGLWVSRYSPKRREKGIQCSESLEVMVWECLVLMQYLIKDPAVQQCHQLMKVALCGVEYLLNLPEWFLQVAQSGQMWEFPCRVFYLHFSVQKLLPTSALGNCGRAFLSRLERCVWMLDSALWDWVSS